MDSAIDIAPKATQRLIGWVVAVIALVGLGIGLAQAPFGDWTGIERFDAVIMALLAVAGIYYGIRGGIYTSKQDLRRQRSWAWTALVLLSMSMAVLIFLDVSSWTVIDTFSVATWLIVLVIFVPQIIFINRALKAGH